MLDSLSQRLSKIVKTMRGQARLTEANTKDMLREVRLALLEADVALPVVKEVLARIKEKAMGEEVVGNLNPGQALVILLAGLQGAGKTTTAGKLARWLVTDQKKKVLTVSCDVYRPAAIDQLKAVTEQAGADWFPSTVGEKPLDIASRAVSEARRRFYDVLIVDTAGRLAIDEAMMQEVAELNTFLKPAETLFVIDAMLGQDAVNTARAFNERLPLTGIVLTKADGDSRGGAALSVHGLAHPRHGRHRRPREGRDEVDQHCRSAEAREEALHRRPVRPHGLPRAARADGQHRQLLLDP